MSFVVFLLILYIALCVIEYHLVSKRIAKLENDHIDNGSAVFYNLRMAVDKLNLGFKDHERRINALERGDFSKGLVSRAEFESDYSQYIQAIETMDDLHEKVAKEIELMLTSGTMTFDEIRNYMDTIERKLNDDYE